MNYIILIIAFFIIGALGIVYNKIFLPKNIFIIISCLAFVFMVLIMSMGAQSVIETSSLIQNVEQIRYYLNQDAQISQEILDTLNEQISEYKIAALVMPNWNFYNKQILELQYLY